MEKVWPERKKKQKKRETAKARGESSFVDKKNGLVVKCWRKVP